MAAVLLGVEERVLQAEGKVSSRLSGLGRASECLRDKPAHILVVDKAFGRSPPRQTDGRTDRQTDRDTHLAPLWCGVFLCSWTMGAGALAAASEANVANDMSDPPPPPPPPPPPAPLLPLLNDCCRG